MIDLKKEDMDLIMTIIEKHVPDCEVRAFGSRVSGGAREFSDLDLALVGEEEIDRRKIEALKDAFAESDLPIMVDVLDWRGIGEEFRKVTEKEYEVLQKPRRDFQVFPKD